MPLRPQARRAVPAPDAPQWPVETPSPDTQCTSRPHFEQLNEVLKLTFEIGLHLQELEPEHLRVDRDRMIASTSSLRLVDEIVGLHRLLSDGVDGVLEDLALSACHIREG
jgi:hypothetical protein